MIYSVLESLLAEDGHDIPTAGGTQKMIRCPSPHHDDKNPSCSVNLAEGVYKCFSCGIGGNAYGYLVDIRGLDTKDAMDILKAKGWKEEGRTLLKEAHQNEANRKKGRPTQVEAPLTYIRNKSGQNIAQMISTHDYQTADGTLVCRVARYEKLIKEKVRVPKILPYTPRTGGGWWLCWPTKDSLPEEDRHNAPMPLYRLPELLKMMGAMNPNSQVIMVEGEKCVDALLSAKDPPKNRPLPCTTAPGGSNAILENIDFTPLDGQRKLIMADTDKKGREYAEKVARKLYLSQKGEVKVVLPLGDGGYDVADVCTEGGWPKVIEWIREIGSQVFVDIEPPPPHPDSLADELKMPFSHTEHFRVLGLVGTRSIAIQTFSNYEVHVLARGGLNSVGTLNTLAPIEWWYDAVKSSHGFNESTRARVQSNLLRAAEAKGFIALHEIKGMGAYKSGNSYYWNVGTHVLCENGNGLLTEKKTFADVSERFTPGPQIKLTDSTKGERYARELYDAVVRYRFTNKKGARAFMGWIVTSLVGGALDFRPMLWLLGLSGTGKTFLLSSVLTSICGNALVRLAEPSEAGISQFLSSSSLPVYVDEFEPKQSSQGRFDGILALVRMCTSGEAQRLRGGASGEISSITSPRFSLLASSIHQINLSEADASRFYPVMLSRHGVQDWPEVQRAIAEACTTERGEVIRTYIIERTRKIIEHANIIENKLISGSVNSRTAKMVAALTAGACLFSGDDELVERPTDDNIVDTYDLLDELLSAKMKYAHGDLTVSEALRKIYFGPGGKWVATEAERNSIDQGIYEMVSRHGFKMADNGREMRIAYSLPPLQALLKDTRYENVNLYHYFKSLPGVTQPKHNDARASYKKLRFGGTLRPYMSIPLEVLDQIGFLPDLSPAEEAFMSGDVEEDLPSEGLF